MSRQSPYQTSPTQAHEHHRPYCGHPAPLDPQQSDKSQNASHTPPCTLTDEPCHPCQTENIKGDHYQGIEVGSNEWVKRVCDEAHAAAKNGGGPFAALLLQIDGTTQEVLRYWIARNSVTEHNDPTAHAEVNAIRAACQQLGVYHLGEIDRQAAKLPQTGEHSYCVMYSSSEPCPMCLSAIYWAHIPTVIFAATRLDASQKGVEFDDDLIYRELCSPYLSRQQVSMYQANCDSSLDAFNFWKRNPKTPY